MRVAGFQAWVRGWREWDPASFFLGVGLLFALLYALITPPFQVADEYAHFERAFAIANGEFLPRANPGPGTEGWFLPLDRTRAQTRGGGTVVPESVLRSYGVVEGLTFRPENRITWDALRAELGKGLASDRSAFLVNNAVVYTPVPYLPQALMIALLQPLDASPFWLLYAGRCAAALTWGLLVYAALRLMPWGRWIMALVALSPMAVSLGGSLSADAVTMGCFFLFTAFLLRHLPDARLSGRTLVLMAVLGLALAGCKGVYTLLLPLVLFWTPKQFGPRWRYALFLLLALGGPLLCSGWWSARVQPLFLPADSAQPAAQAEQMRAHPAEFAGVVARTVAEYSRVYARHFAGSLGWLDAQLPFAVAALYCLGLLVVALADAAPPGASAAGAPPCLGLTSGRRYFGLLLFGVLFLIMCASMYLVWNSYRNPVIVGLHGRYFIPLAPLGLLCLLGGISAVLRRGRVSGGVLERCLGGVPLLALFCLTVGALTLLGRYYGIGPLVPGAPPAHTAPAMQQAPGSPRLLDVPWPARPAAPQAR